MHTNKQKNDTKECPASHPAWLLQEQARALPPCAVPHLALPLALQIDHTEIDNGPQVLLAIQNLHKAVGLCGIRR